MITIGFGTSDLSPAFGGTRPVRTPIEANALFVSSADLKALWLVVDAMDMDAEIVGLLRDAVQTAAAVPPGHIHILSTHNHGCNWSEADAHAFAARAAQAAAEAADTAQPALMRCAVTHAEQQLNYRRRIFVPEADGAATCFFGPFEGNAFNASEYIEAFLADLQNSKLAWTGRAASDRPMQAFPPADPTLAILQFVSANAHRPLGSVVRFAAHAVCCNITGEYLSSDYPYHLRQRLKNDFGGKAIFLNGPCAEIAPGLESKRSGHDAILGNALADLAEHAVKDTPFTPLASFGDDQTEVALPVRPEVIANHVDVPDSLPEAMPERKKALERLALKNNLPFLRGKYLNGIHAPNGTAAIQLGHLRLNDVHVIAFPGETFWRTADAVLAACPFNAITVTEHGRTVMYLPPEDDARSGGYEPTCQVTAREAEALLRQAAIRAFNHNPMMF